MTTETETEQTYTYIGLRLSRHDKPFHAWLDEQGEEHWYTKNLAPGAGVGQQYRVTVRGTSVLLGGDNAPAFQRFLAGDPRLPEWRADEQMATTRQEALRASKRYKAVGAASLGRMTLAEAARWYRTQALSHQRAGALAVLIGYIQSGPLPAEDE